MNIRVVCIGDELLSGDTLNTNLLYVGEKLNQAGLRLSKESCVPDEENLLRGVLADCRGADVVIIIGGLGPTKDDLTRPVTASFLNRKLILHPEIKEHIAEYLGQRARMMPQEALEVQAQVPEGATVLPNSNGTAPALMISEGETLWFLLPGPPKEMRPIFDEQVMPKILAHGQAEWQERVFRVVGVGESIVEARVQKALGENVSCLHLAYCIKKDNVLVKIAKPFTQSEPDLDAMATALQQEFGGHLIPRDCGCAAEYLGHVLRERHLTLSTAESCTGGGIATAITDIAGSSEWFTGAFVTYANEWKEAQLGVPKEILRDYGAVSYQTVSRMLSGLLEKGGADLGIAVSGIAGPGGGLPDKPVGTVFIGIAGKGWQLIRRVHFNGLRDTVRMRTISTAINMLLEKLL